MQAPPPPAPRWRTAERSPSPPLRRHASLSPGARSCGGAERPLADAALLRHGAAQPPCEAAGSPAFEPGPATVARWRGLLARHAAERAATADAADAWLDGPPPRTPPSPSPRASVRTPLGTLSTQQLGDWQERGAKPTPTRCLEDAALQENVEFRGFAPLAEPLPTPLRDALPTPARAEPSPGFTFALPPASPARMPAVFSVWQDTEDDPDAEQAADALAAKRRARTALRALARAVQLRSLSRTQLEAAARAHRERTAARALRGWHAALARARRRTSLSLVSQLRAVATRLRSAFNAWAAVARETALLRDQHGAAAAAARCGRLARALAAWRTAAACRAPRLLALRPLLAGWRAAAAQSVASLRAVHAGMRLRLCFSAWAAAARSCGGVGVRAARARAALMAFQELRRHLRAVEVATAAAGAPPAAPLMPAAVESALARIAQRRAVVA